jgi:glycosyltransferase involved in cell wall biosynthesis
LNNVTLEEIISFYQRSHIVMFASTYEGFGMPLIEGQSVGRPVITSNIEPMKSLSNGAALLVNPYFVNEIAIAIEELIKKPELVDKLVELGLDNVKKYSIETISDQYSSIYEMLT